MSTAQILIMKTLFAYVCLRSLIVFRNNEKLQLMYVCTILGAGAAYWMYRGLLPHFYNDAFWVFLLPATLFAISMAMSFKWVIIPLEGNMRRTYYNKLAQVALECILGAIGLYVIVFNAKT
jgi:hypothetical protein